ncbi:ribonuclease III [Frankia sp. CNm7]|uniref:ribonuclease III n=1 Tax=Frankia nepalensis TaxID=1836974 RepID=UPI00193386AC|nr:ribonuclease III [Frankia nepalensis]MBL7520987.1 ribonuclease III [Frankia nepalensis]
MSRGVSFPQARAGLLEALDLRIAPELLDQALTHRSYSYENGNLPTNERLEFLGDAVLQLVITNALYRRHPTLAEGALAKQRASVVNMRALAAVARGIGPVGIGPYLLLGKGEETTGGRDKPSILADTLEALIGAVYLELGLEVASAFVHRHFDPLLDDAARRGAGLDWKTSLQERTAVLNMGPPDYVVSDSGPDHAKRFTARARISDRIYGEGEGGSKKEAEQRAAERAFLALEGLTGATVTAEPAGGPAGPTAAGVGGAAGGGAGVVDGLGQVPGAAPSDAAAVGLGPARAPEAG